MKKAFALIISAIILLPGIFFLLNSIKCKNKLSCVNKWFILLSFEPQKYCLKKDKFLSYDMAILDPDSHPPFEKIKNKPILIAYVSLGEAADYRYFWERIKDKNWVLGTNPNWPGDYYVDVRNKEWQDLVIQEVIPQVKAKGFKGIMMDTLDTAAYLEDKDSLRFKGMKSAMINFVKRIHQAHPELFLISNNGFAILEEIAPDLSALLSEDINMMIDFEGESYKKVPDEERDYKIRILKKLKDAYSLPVFVIDYCPQDKKDLISYCIKENKGLGFKPYIAEKNLDKLYEN